MALHLVLGTAFFARIIVTWSTPSVAPSACAFVRAELATAAVAASGTHALTSSGVAVRRSKR